MQSKSLAIAALSAALVFAPLFVFASGARAEIVKMAVPDTSGLKLFWWPKLPVLAGWHQDPGASQAYSVNALVPDGQSFSDADTVMLGKANYKPSTPAIKTVQQLVDDDIKVTTQQASGVQVHKAADIADADGKSFTVYDFAPAAATGGVWEAVAYGEEGDYFLIFMTSARSKAGFDKNLPVFEQLVKTYAEKLP